VKAWAAPLLALLLADIAEAAQTPPCRSHPDLVGRCRTAHDRFMFTNGTPGKRIWVVGTHRMLGISEAPGHGSEGIESLPVNMQAVIGRSWRIWVYGDFEICPFARQRPGEMQMVCVARARRLYVQRL
jgi:hypothetical protein